MNRKLVRLGDGLCSLVSGQACPAITTVGKLGSTDLIEASVVWVYDARHVLATAGIRLA